MRSVIARDGIRRILSKSEKRLLEAVVNSKDVAGLSIKALCEKAKCQPKVYYKMIEDPEFGSLLPQAIDYLLGQQMIPVIQMVIKRALDGSAKHAELVLKIVGLIGSDDATKILQVFNQGEPRGSGLLTEAQVDRLLGIGE